MSGFIFLYSNPFFILSAAYSAALAGSTRRLPTRSRTSLRGVSSLVVSGNHLHPRPSEVFISPFLSVPIIFIFIPFTRDGSALVYLAEGAQGNVHSLANPLLHHTSVFQYVLHLLATKFRLYYPAEDGPHKFYGEWFHTWPSSFGILITWLPRLRSGPCLLVSACFKKKGMPAPTHWSRSALSQSM